MRKISDEAVFREVARGSGLTMAVFKTTWCKDCHFIEPFMPAVEAAYADRIAFVEIDRDDMESFVSGTGRPPGPPWTHEHRCAYAAGIAALAGARRHRRMRIR